MRITPIAADSMGTRSSATFIETDDIKIFIDPSAALGPYRHGKEPHPMEWQRLKEHWDQIRAQAKKADALIVTHYHYDHYNPHEPELYKGKKVFLKHPKENINKSQTARAAFFLQQIEGLPENLTFSDGTKHLFGKTKLIFSKAVFHGTNNKLGYVTEISIKEVKETFCYTSDVEGPSVDEQARFLLEQKPTTAYIDGPMTYMLGYRYSHHSLEQSLKNIIELVGKAKPDTIIIEHHLLRDKKWNERIRLLLEKKGKTRIMTAAQYAGKEIDQLEAKRTELWKEYPDMKMPADLPKVKDE